MKLFSVSCEYGGPHESDLSMIIWANDAQEAIALWKEEGATLYDIEEYNPFVMEIPLKAPKKPKVLQAYQDMPVTTV